MKLALLLLGACAVEAPPPAAYDWQLPPGFAAPRVPADNPMTADKVELGRYLFYDPRLSGNGTQACASCHVQARAFTDGRTTALGSTGISGRHNALTIVNAAYASSYTWADPGVADLESQATIPMFAALELDLTEDVLEARLRADARYQVQFPAAFPGDAAPFTAENTARALASFERTILSGDSPFDRFSRGDRTALDDAQQRGLAVFESVGCPRCHEGFDLTVATGDRPVMFNTGLYNVGGTGAYPDGDRGLVEHTGIATDTGRFKPPTLRDIAVTAPYMHDGSVATLADAIDIYARGGRAIAGGPDAGDGATSPYRSPLLAGFAITDDQKADLLAFLGALTDDGLLADPRFANPWP